MIDLNETLFVGKGRTRSCFVHPLDSGKCIKIDKRKSGGATEREGKYFEKIARIHPNFQYIHIPRFYGFVETTLGRGGVFDLIRDETTNEISKSFLHYIRIGDVAADLTRWRQAHHDYLKTLYDEPVIIRDFNPSNLCARMMHDGSCQLVTIDGIGHRHSIPLCDHSKWFARFTLRRHVERKNFESLEGILKRAEEKLEYARLHPKPKK